MITSMLVGSLLRSQLGRLGLDRLRNPWPRILALSLSLVPGLFGAMGLLFGTVS